MIDILVLVLCIPCLALATIFQLNFVFDDYREHKKPYIYIKAVIKKTFAN